MVKNLPANAGDTGSIPGSGKSPGGGICNLLQYSCLKNPMDRGAWQVHGVAKSRIQLSDRTHKGCPGHVLPWLRNLLLLSMGNSKPLIPAIQGP